MWQGPTKLYLPPSQPVARVLSTEEYVEPTRYYYYGQSDRLICIGHPFYPVLDREQKVVVQQVSANQYRAFRVKLPDPNRFAFADPDFYNPDNSRLVWLLKAVEIGRGGPIGVGTTGHPLFNKLGDTENAVNRYLKENKTKDDRQSTSFDPKSTQIFVVGSTPCIGSHWGAAKPCSEAHNPEVDGHCPPIQLYNTPIQDGDFGDIGLGNIDFKELQEDRSSAPLEINTKICKFPDFLKMQAEPSGDSCWFYGRRESLYARHYFCRAGINGEAYPNDVAPSDYYLPTNANRPDDGRENERRTAAPPNYFAMPSGSLNTTDSQLFNRAFFLRKAQGANNGVCWNNELFVTVLDNTRNVNFTINMHTAKEAPTEYDSSKFKVYTRHCEIYELSFVFQIGRIPLKGDILAHINAMNPRVIQNWNLGFVPVPTSNTGDEYRYIDSLATRCAEPEAEKAKDPYEGYTFWNVDLSEKLTLELDQYNLGRKFLGQIAYTPRVRRSLKRTSTSKSKRSAKRKRT
ncbi:L2 [Tick-associated papillomavirus lsx]|nr:L2 [Tick-associated papillomavirus lsx]